MRSLRFLYEFFSSGCSFMMRSQLLSVCGAALLSAACASQSPQVESPPPSSSEASDPAGSSGEEEKPRADVLRARPAPVPAAPASCVQGELLPAPQSCAALRPQLVRALQLDGAQRDAALQELEVCEELPAGWVRALRAELAPPECGDVLIEPLVTEGSGLAAGPWRDTLVGLALSSRLRRLAVSPPPAPASREKSALEAYFREALFPWVQEQASAIYGLAAQGAALSGYARGVVAIEAGMADMRFVEIVREVPIPVEMEADPEVRDVYYASLDEALEPRKERGRDAALVGLRELARQGVQQDARVDVARQLLSRVFGGKRISALDELLLPPEPELDLSEPVALLAAELPVPYAAEIFSEEALSDVWVFSAQKRGFSLGLARQLETSSEPLWLYRASLARLRSGQLFFRAEDFQTSAHLLSQLLDTEPAARSALSAEQWESARFYRALAVALSAGPRDAVELFARGPRFADALGNLVLLDALAEGTSPHAGRAAFNGAYLRELVVPADAPAAWQDLETRYRRAAQLLQGAERKQAEERAQAARAIATNLKNAK